MAAARSCNPDDPKAKRPDYICNFSTGKWIKVGGRTHRKLMESGMTQSYSVESAASSQLPEAASIVKKQEQESACACLTPIGRPCPRDSMDNEGCWRGTIANIAKYLDGLPTHRCYRPSVTGPIYTIIFSLPELTSMQVGDLRELCSFYLFDRPGEHGNTFFRGIINGHYQERPGSIYGEVFAPSYTRLLETYYPIDILGSKPLAEKELLIKALLYYYRLLDRYGCHPDLVKTTCRYDHRFYSESVGPAIEASFRGTFNVKKFYRAHRTWFDQQAEQQLPFIPTIDYYSHLGHDLMDSDCREGKSVRPRSKYRRLIHAITLASASPAAFVIFWPSERLPEDYHIPGECVEKGFMRASLVPAKPENLASLGIRHYFRLYLPAGTPCLNLVLHNSLDCEVLLPPGTRFRIFETADIGKTRVHSGIVC